MALLNWYDRHARALPWRVKQPDPYRVWLAEIMLQQTTVATVKPYFEAFLRQFPSLQKLAAAPEAQVMAAWAGLGYYSRARNLLKCARVVVAEHDGRFPSYEAALLKLPGIGPYTAAAIAAIAFDRVAAPVDGNIERVLARLFCIKTPPPALKSRVTEKMRALVPPRRPGDFVQALMDLGATVCTPKNPACEVCPWQKQCAAYKAGTAEVLPRRAPKRKKPSRVGTVYWLENARGCVLMHRRPDKGLLGGMLAFPSTGWDELNDSPLPDLVPQGWTRCAGEVRHIFTHFHLTLKVQRRAAPKGFRKPASHEWIAPKNFSDEALPSVMQKVAKLVMSEK